MIHEIFMPALSSTMTEGKIVSWLKAPGDKVEKGETVVVVESDKADMDVESFYEGFLATIVVDAGNSAPVGSAIALLAETEAEIEAAKQQATQTTPSAPAATAAATTPTPEPVAAAATNGSSSAPTQNGRIVASPRARKLAKELKVELGAVVGSGPHGRIVAEDIEKAAGKTPTVKPAAKPAAPVAPAVAAAPAPRAASAPVAPTQPGQIKPMTTLQTAVVRNMNASLDVPVFRASYTITTDALDKLYKQVKSKGVTMSALLTKAIAMALQKHPLLYASYVENGIHFNESINIANAVAMEDGGLITPVLKNADQQDLYSLSRNWKDLVDRARSKQLQPDEYSSGTFTVSNLGMFGVDAFDAILPPGQGAILAIGASRPTVVATDDGLLGVRRQMQVNITCDHRIIYGADAAIFLRDLAKLIETDVQSLTL
ncbi:branched-chain alpha-keto acid dehydrogenase subunit E2 [Leptolyngbya boryana NIES-2135]|jgi:pyruvate dehydrogenase E2 component (dihydrolipoamide acetyltransferase)|uniref:Dihydrolipoamide acetyltransferase component of pyruvate dehydrogenase complex n=1 Tax=Leptolyngbya boryana NIES-2135 TaxID=1973484 RepID=A0A1Z4JQW3_LEPBY|nr:MULTISPECIES: dihydrolipoamide acetyltransferase family protein [Leptolyngbya]BAY59099.1 branched-chain alpha-keto acid dehydrogenase subunit E2 [Leptolyngbya boryana NIES-2135]MBD2368153.1 2-oxo acid dehydrogenase subunit E2 [Leptolyngbya sp. FACHB-161]MBD2374810.1 2-oxo acid dehydrogenase subunit E2 [Leptolyngbya sp. FACHB-238]MBD2399232.1 2-oxo acid dehydrogenase subunit E2 [Leptolyngbya sp. FACHB-239]MBD2405237.1 2-oxo acid dehydrogenase subunit E2 [Leptolyngbya sp. FACHB-402]